LRRLLDEPVAVSDAEARHLDGCSRCRRRAEVVAADADYAVSLLGTGSGAPTGAVLSPGDAATDQAWARIVSQLGTGPGRAGAGERDRQARRRTAAPWAVPSWSVTPHAPRWIGARAAPRRWRLAGTTLGSGATIAGAGVVLAGVAAAASLSTTVFAPTSVAPVAISTSDLQPLSTLLDAGRLPDLQDVRQGSGTKTLTFGTLDWTSSGAAQQVSSLAAAEAATGLNVVLPTTLPNGVGSPSGLLAVPAVTATIQFDSRAGSLAGSTLRATVGPVVLASYGGRTGSATTLAVITAAQPVATSNGASTGQLENFLLSQPGVPPDLAAQIRLLGDLDHTLPVPAMPGLDTERTTVGASPALAIHDPSNAVSGVIWQDRDGTVHAVAGLLDEEDVLGVAGQIG
jgi:hypothetical protein